MTRGNIQGFCFNEVMLLKKLAFQYHTQKLLSGEWHVKTGSLVKPGMTEAQSGMTEARLGMTEAQPGMTGAVRNNEGSQFREDEHQSPSFLRKQESKGNGHPTRKTDKKWKRHWKIELIEKGNPEWVD